MREIKFRAYTEISNEVLGMKYDVPHNYNDTVMQFIGLKDKNGKEIYEGDIIQIYHTNSKEGVIEKIKGDIGSVVFKNYYFGLDFGNGTILGGYFAGGLNGEVLGNIYENPDLLPTQPQE